MSIKNKQRHTTVLQQRVWDALKKIPRGKVTTYGALAQFLNTKAVRAVASAVGKNPHAPRIPCHRVVRADGSVGKYSARGGVAQKCALLKKEGVRITNGRIDVTETLFTFTQTKDVKCVFVPTNFATH